jgi:hypothetical protein
VFLPKPIDVSCLFNASLLGPSKPGVCRPQRNVLIGFAVEAYCVDLPLDEFISICNSLYFQVNTSRIFHGLKRIWEFLDQCGLHTDTGRDKHLDIEFFPTDQCRNVAASCSQTKRSCGLAVILSEILLWPSPDDNYGNKPPFRISKQGAFSYRGYEYVRCQSDNSTVYTFPCAAMEFWRIIRLRNSHPLWGKPYE